VSEGFHLSYSYPENAEGSSGAFGAYLGEKCAGDRVAWLIGLTCVCPTAGCTTPKERSRQSLNAVDPSHNDATADWKDGGEQGGAKQGIVKGVLGEEASPRTRAKTKIGATIFKKGSPGEKGSRSKRNGKKNNYFQKKSLRSSAWG